MKPSRAIIPALLLLALAFAASAAQAPRRNGKEKPRKDQNPATSVQPCPRQFNEVEIEGYAVIKQCKTMNRAVSGGKLKPADISLFAGWYQRFAEHPDIEKETNVSRDWFKLVSDTLNEYYENLLKLQNAQEDGLKQELETAQTTNDGLMRKFKQLASRPAKLKK
jgi:hypothetical protein